MKRPTLVLIAFLTILFQNMPDTQARTEKKSASCPQLQDCLKSWKEGKHNACIDACTKVREGCSAEHISAANAYRLSCRNNLKKLEAKSK